MVTEFKVLRKTETKEKTTKQNKTKHNENQNKTHTHKQNKTKQNKQATKGKHGNSLPKLNYYIRTALDYINKIKLKIMFNTLLWTMIDERKKHKMLQPPNHTQIHIIFIKCQENR